MFALPTPTKARTGTRPRASVVRHGVGIAAASLNLIGDNSGRFFGCLALLHDHIFANPVECERFGYFYPMLARYGPLLAGSIGVKHRVHADYDGQRFILRCHSNQSNGRGLYKLGRLKRGCW